jgi:glycosyltransferase involved in cell wall biosynthesis
LLRAKKRRGGGRPVHIFVTQNGDWPAQAGNREYRWFGCDGLICINPVFHERNKDRFKSWLIPNAVDPARFVGATPDRNGFGLPPSGRVVVIVSALIASKRVLEGVRAVAKMDDAHLLVVGDGPLRDQVDAEGRRLIGSRFQRVTLPFERMPSLYRSADVLLHMSQDEPFGNIYVEALAAGLPVVTHDWTSTRWLFERHAELVDTDNPEAVREGIRKVIDANTPAAAAGRRELVERRFTWRAVADGYAQCLRTLIQT